MKKILLVLSFLVLTAVAASAQMNRTVRGNAPQPRVSHRAPTGIPSACSPCVWYSGDLDPANVHTNGLRNDNTPGYGLNFVWVPVVAASDGNTLNKHFSITTITFNELTTTPDTNPPTDFAGMTFGLRSGVIPGSGGTSLKSGICPATSVVYAGQTYVYNEYSYTCDKRSKPIKILVGKIYWINVMPKFTGSTLAYLSDSIDVAGLNQFGWGNDFFNSFNDSAFYGISFESTQSCCFDPDGLAMFSVAIGGNYVP